ncbi:MAG: DUF4194 domain-containing protein [Coriobacteriia bacterium]|nr:DUF4194 domain-containing protein [Coriobacteriia bacterium]
MCEPMQDQSPELETNEPVDTPSNPNALTQTDRGRLPEATRRALVQLLRGPYVSEKRHNKIWATLIHAEDVIRERLGDLFLELVFDRDSGVAFVRNMHAEDTDLPKVVRNQRLTLIDTALVLFLREQLLNAEATGRRSFVGQTEIHDHLSVYHNRDLLDEVTFYARVNSSIERMKKNSVLHQTVEGDRYEISPILSLVFDADQVIVVTRELQRLLAEHGNEDIQDSEASLVRDDSEEMINDIGEVR